jgi:hypothetical protein
VELPDSAESLFRAKALWLLKLVRPNIASRTRRPGQSALIGRERHAVDVETPMLLFGVCGEVRGPPRIETTLRLLAFGVGVGISCVNVTA